MFLLMEYCSGTSKLTRFFPFFLSLLDRPAAPRGGWKGAAEEKKKRKKKKKKSKGHPHHLTAREAYNMHVWADARRRINRFHEHPTSTPTH